MHKKEREAIPVFETEQAAPTTIDEFIAAFPPDVQEKLQQIRATIREAAPEAQEAIKYGIPTFVLHGNLVHFSAYTEHIGFYPAPTGIEAFREELAIYGSSKGTVRFPLTEPIPFDLISRIVRYRVVENTEKAAAKRRPAKP
jgi:uncharacterized protein YdhG (YjbR/CyaY superfamily)